MRSNQKMLNMVREVGQNIKTIITTPGFFNSQFDKKFGETRKMYTNH